MPELKRLNLTIKCEATYTSSIFVPVELTTEEATEHVRKHIADMPAGILNRVPNSEVLVENSCFFDNEIPSIMDEFNHGNKDKALTYFQAIINEAYESEGKPNNGSFDIYPCGRNCNDKWYLILHCQYFNVSQKVYGLLTDRLRKDFGIGIVSSDAWPTPKYWTGTTTMFMCKIQNTN